jgi:hypothetical protein
MRSVSLVVLSAAAAWAQNEATVSGRITDALTNVPIPGVRANYCCPDATALTDFSGAYSIAVKPNGASGWLAISKSGYAPMNAVAGNSPALALNPGDSVRRDFTLIPAGQGIRRADTVRGSRRRMAMRSRRSVLTDGS